MKSQNPTTQPDLFGELLIETIPYSQFQDRLAELNLAGYRVSSVTVDHKKGQYRVVARKEL